MQIILRLLSISILYLAIIFLTKQQLVAIEINKQWHEYPCYYDTQGTQWCGGGMEAKEKLLDRLNEGKWRVDFMKEE